MLIKSKITAPRPLKNAIPRLHLLNDFEATKLALINAPAGYGKTSLMTEWSEHQPHNAWFSIDNYDNDAQQFAEYFIFSLATLESVHCPASLEMVKQNNHIDLITLFTLFLMKPLN
ncbi:hypothetical protein ACLKMH_21600 [Psychromonas sp. KJ10-10]|uniref:hypothetical protein n=1 Tax=Psychromonas sp. KJ10-10 TaxID=3391823 RepID=UPI0039B582E3